MLSIKQKKLLNNQIKFNLNKANYTDTNKEITYNKKVTSKNVIEYLTNDPLLTFPLKSFAIAIIYGLLIEKYFKISLYDSLNNKLLLFNNDKFFIPYYKNKKVYKQTISYFGKNNILSINSNTVNVISTYWYKEFNITHHN